MNRLISIVLLLTSAPAFAGWDYLEAFDVKRCIHWAITNDIGGYDDQGYKAAKALRDKAGEDWAVFSAGSSYGVCRWQESSGKTEGFTCLPGGEFPIAGATFKKIAGETSRLFGSDIALQSYKCVDGCSAIGISMIYDNSYEGEPGSVEENIEYKQSMRRFDRKCRNATGRNNPK